MDNIKKTLKRKNIEFTELKKDDYVLVREVCYLKDRLKSNRKCKNRILSISARVIKDYEGGLICLRPSVDIYDFFEAKNILQHQIV